MKPILCLLLVFTFVQNGGAPVVRRPIPNKLVVLTFDDASSSHATVVAPILNKYGFGATFFVCEFPPDFADKQKYMSWAQMRALDRQGFEVANHTLTHKHVNKLTRAQFGAELDSLEARCRTHGIRRPVTFAYPGYDTHPNAFAVLAERGYQFARVGGNRAYDPTKDHPYLVPSFTMLGTNRDEVRSGLQQAQVGRPVVLTIHGVPDYAHDWVTTPPALFEEHMQFLRDNGYTVIALRDLARYVDVREAARTIRLPTNE